MPLTVIRAFLNKMAKAIPVPEQNISKEGKIDLILLLVLISAFAIYFVVMPMTHIASIQTETLTNIGYFNENINNHKWDSGLGTDVLKQISNASHLDCAPRVRYLHWLVEWFQAKIDVRRIYLFGFSLYNYTGVFTNLLNCFLVFLLIYRLLKNHHAAIIGAVFFLMSAQSLAVPFYRYSNKFKTITFFLFISYVIARLDDKSKYLFLKGSFLASIKNSLREKKDYFNPKNMCLFIFRSLLKGIKFMCLSIYQNSWVFYGLFFIVSLINSFADENSLMCVIPWLFLVLFFRGIGPFIICSGISTWVLLFYISFYYLAAPKIYYYYYKGAFWNPEQDFFQNANYGLINNMLFGFFKPATYELLFKQLGGILGYSGVNSLKWNFLHVIILISVSVSIIAAVKSRGVKIEKMFYKMAFLISFACIMLWQINSILMGGRVYNFPYNYPIVILSIPAGIAAAFCYERLAGKRYMGRLTFLIISVIIFNYNIKAADDALDKEFKTCNSIPFHNRVIRPIQKMGNFMRRHWDKRPFYISYPNLSGGRYGVTPAGYSERDMLFGFQAVIPAFFIRYFEKGDILSTVTPYEEYYVKKISPAKARLFYSISREQMIDLGSLISESQEIGEISNPIVSGNSININQQLGLPEIDHPAKELEFNICLRKTNMASNIKIGFFFRSKNDPSTYTPLKMILFENEEKTKEIPIEYDYGYSFKFYDIFLTKAECKNVKLIIEFEELKANYILAGPFLFTGDIWKDTI